MNAMLVMGVFTRAEEQTRSRLATVQARAHQKERLFDQARTEQSREQHCEAKPGGCPSFSPVSTKRAQGDDKAPLLAPLSEILAQTRRDGLLIGQKHLYYRQG